MNWEELNVHLKETLKDEAFKEPNEFQREIHKQLKKGGNALIKAAIGSGKSTSMLINALLKSPDSYEGSPRALLICSTLDNAFAVHKTLQKLTRRTEISVELIHEKGNMILERNALFDGADIVVATPKRLHDIYIQNGIHFNQLKFVAIDDLEAICANAAWNTALLRIAESLPKCQRFFYFEKEHPRMEGLIENWMHQYIEING